MSDHAGRTAEEQSSPPGGERPQDLLMVTHQKMDEASACLLALRMAERRPASWPSACERGNPRVVERKEYPAPGRPAATRDGGPNGRRRAAQGTRDAPA